MGKMLSYHFHCVFTPIKLLLPICVLILNCVIVYSAEQGMIPENNIKAMIFMLYMPLNFKLDILRILLILLPFFLILGTFIDSEINERTSYILFRVKKVQYWFHSMIITCLLFLFTVFFIGFLITLGIVMVLPKQTIEVSWFDSLVFFNVTNQWSLLMHQFVLLILAIFLLLLLNMLFLFITNQMTFSFLFTMLCLLGILTIGYAFPNILKYLPLTYGFLAFREISDYSFLFTYIGILTSVLILYISNFKIFMVRKDMLFMKI